MSDQVHASITTYLASFAALLGALNMGYALAYTGVAYNSMDNIFDKDHIEEQKSWVGAVLGLGALMGGVLSEPCNKLLGRRLSLILFGIPFTAGWLFFVFGNGITMLILGRILTGFCCGLVSGTAPSYVVEIAPVQIRGLLGTCFQVMVVIGMLMAALLATILSWKALAGTCIIFCVGMSVLMFAMPETPQWLISKGRNEEAEASLRKLRTGAINDEFNRMTQIALNVQEGSSQYSAEVLTSPEFYKPLMFALALMFFQQFSGINAVLFYQTDIFNKAAPTLNSLTAAIYVFTAQVIATILGSLLVDRLGRKILLFSSGFGHVISLALFGIYKFKSLGNDQYQDEYSWLAVVSMIMFISSFSIGFGPIPWMMIPELSSSRVRSLVAAIATAFNWTSVFIVTVSIKTLLNSIGDHTTYWSYAGICAVSCLFVVFVLPETKGKTSEQIQKEILGDEAVVGEPSKQSRPLSLGKVAEA